MKFKISPKDELRRCVRAHTRAFWKEFEAGVTAEVAAAVAALPDEEAASLRAQRDLVDRTWTRASEALGSLTERVQEL